MAIRTSTRNGDTLTLTILGPSATFGEQALIDHRSQRTASAVALDPVETRCLHRNEFEQLRKSSPAVERFLTSVLAAQVRRLSDQLLDALYLTADQRVIRRLAEISDLYTCGDPETTVPLKQEDLASIAGTTRPTANRMLKMLESDGIITLARGQIIVINRAELHKRAR